MFFTAWVFVFVGLMIVAYLIFFRKKNNRPPGRNMP